MIETPSQENMILNFQLKRIKHGLSELDAGKFLVLHGMPGSGKTVLAAEAIRDPEITLRVRSFHQRGAPLCYTGIGKSTNPRFRE